MLTYYGHTVRCAAGGPLNWNRDVANRPSLSSLAAGLGTNQAIREGYLRVHRQVCLLPEEYTGANIFHRVADLTYDAQLPGAWTDELSGERVTVGATRSVAMQLYQVRVLVQ